MSATCDNLQDERPARAVRQAARILDACAQRGLTLGCAESCTGGLLSAAFTDITGSSQSFKGGIVSYWAEVKESVLGVDSALIDEYGVVSEQCAAAMAEGARRILGCDVALSTTGIAGPGGAEPGKPVGTVCIALSSDAVRRVITICAEGGRAQVRAAAVEEALGLLASELF